MDTAIKIVELFNAASPGIAELIMIIKKNDGTITVAAMLNEADAKFQESIDRGKAWLAANK